MKVALDLDLDVAHGDRVEIAGLGVASDVDHLDEMGVPMLHECHLDQRMRVGLELASVRKQMVGEIADESAVSFRTVRVVERAEVPGQPRYGPFAELFDDEAGRVGVLPV